MNKTELKSFATTARRDLLEKVALRAKLFGIDEANGLHMEELFGQISINGQSYSLNMRSAFISLERELKVKGYEQLIEEVAYTWFNRIIAIRYMEVNGYLPERVNVLSSSTGKAEPDILLQYESMDLNIEPEDIASHIRTGETEEAYRKLFVAQCNALNKILPFLFENINDYTELLLPDYLLDQESIIRKLVNEVSDSNFFTINESGSKKDNVEVLGWLYQYYMAEKKAEFGGLTNVAVKKEHLPVVTQLFTPKWIVQYMVQNSLGKLYDEKHENNQLASKWEYYLKHQENHKKVPKFSNLEELKIFDPACGSGHILVYAFDMLYEMYEVAGYPTRDISKLILTNNLYGLDIDKRAQQIANFALLMKAVERQPRFLSFMAREKQKITMNVHEIIDSSSRISEEALSLFSQAKEESAYISTLLDIFENGKQFGSLIVPPELPYSEWINRISMLEKKENELLELECIEELKEKLLPVLEQGLLLSQKYDVVVTNPPYHNKFNAILKKFMDKEYKDYKSDLYSAFIFRTTQMTKENGYAALMTPFTWMFISSHEKLRKNILKRKNVSSLIQLEYSAFKEATVPICTFVIQNQKCVTYGDFIKLSDFRGENNQSIKVIEAAENPKVSYRYLVNNVDFFDIPGSPIAFWASLKMRDLFKNNKKLKFYAEPRQGLTTCNNDMFVRYWAEVNYQKIKMVKYTVQSSDDKFTWFPYNKGGSFKKWFGNQEFLVNWSKNGQDIHEYNGVPLNYRGAPVRNKEFYFREGITWSRISSSRLGVRYLPSGFIFDVNGPCIFPQEKYKHFLLAFLVSSISFYIMTNINSTFTIQTGYISNLPIVEADQKELFRINDIVKENIAISENDWNSFETSWDFKTHSLLADKHFSTNIESAYKYLENLIKQNFATLKNNEEKLNRIFINLYGLDSELSPNIDDGEITIRKADRIRDTKSFLSYFIGCVMGRYSLDIEGLTYAGGDWDESKYNIFKPNMNGLISLTEERYFESDIIARLREFLIITFAEETADENLEWIAESLTRKENESSEERIRRYFINEFYKDHVKIYQKRPIYWLVDSGKQKGLRTLIYMHRYQPNTLATIRFEHLQEIQAKYNNEIAAIDMRLINPNLSASEKRELEKNKTSYQKRVVEVLEFDKKLAMYANEQIEIDLDDGVVVNHAKFGEILAKI